MTNLKLILTLTDARVPGRTISVFEDSLGYHVAIQGMGVLTCVGDLISPEIAAVCGVSMILEQYKAVG